MKDTVKIQKGNTKMVAHRGLSGIETENTAAAFIAAANRSYYGIETDIHKTADGQFVCMHDDNAKRVSGKRCNILKKTLKEVSAIRLKNFHEGVGPRCDLVPPSLEAVEESIDRAMNGETEEDFDDDFEDGGEEDFDEDFDEEFDDEEVYDDSFEDEEN